MKKLVVLTTLMVLVVNMFPNVPLVWASDLDEEYKELDEEKQEKLEELSEVAKEKEEVAQQKEVLAQELLYFQSELQQKSLTLNEKILIIKQMESKKVDKEKVLEYETQKKNLLLRSLYKNSGTSTVELVLQSDSFSQFNRVWQYHDSVVSSVKERITLIQDLINEIKAVLAEEQKLKASIENEVGALSNQTVVVDGQVKETEQNIDMLSEKINLLEDEIAQITSRQSEIIAQKQASLNLPQSIGGGPMSCSDDRETDPGFSNAYAFFTYGIPHRVGMSQYGALGRAEDGQNAEKILDAYFDDFNLDKNYDTDIEIEVDGYGPYNIEDYVKRIYEMPSSWPMEALKAQAIAARSYALAYTNSGSSSICTTQSCQVFKPEEKDARWVEAVEATAGWVMVGDGPIKAWYSSTAGGYTYESGDVWGGSSRSWTKHLKDGKQDYNSFQDVLNNAYDNSSPCMYAAQGWRSGYNKTAWLKEEEVADIANVIRLARFSDVNKNHLYQVDSDNPEGVDTWSHEKVREELEARGEKAFTGISAISVTGADFDYGRTTQIRINGENFDGTEFKNWFNLRAPANLAIVGPLYNVEKH